MNQTPYIEFKKQRELGDILTDAFGFIRNQFKPFFGTFFKIVGPYLLVMLIAYSFYFYAIGDIMNFNIETSNGAFGPFMILIALFLFLVSIFVCLAMAQATVLYYIRSYANNKGRADFQEVKRDVYTNFWRFFGLVLLVGLALTAGFMLCIIPGIYLYPPLMLAFSILVFDRKSVGDAFSYSFTLIKDNWWATFGTLLVIGIIVAVIGYAFNIPAAMYMWAKMGIFSGEMDAETMSNGFIDPIYVILNLLSVLVQFMLNLVSVVAGALIYFHLNEKKNFTGTYERIENLGKSSQQ